MDWVLPITGIIAMLFLIASMFMLIRDTLSGNRLLQGLKYGAACTVVWTVYLWEPLPHVAPMDRITYPLADSLALLVMGLLLGAFFGNDGYGKPLRKERVFNIISFISVAACFISGRIVQYFVFDIYSSFTERPFETVIWCLITGAAISAVLTVTAGCLTFSLSRRKAGRFSRC